MTLLLHYLIDESQMERELLAFMATTSSIHVSCKIRAQKTKTTYHAEEVGGGIMILVSPRTSETVYIILTTSPEVLVS